MPRLIVWIALAGACAVIFGAFGAHGLQAEAAKNWVATGAHYQGLHAVAALALLQLGHQRSALLMTWGAAIFAFTLYAMALGAPKWLGMITPVGGTMMILAWLGVAVARWRKPD